MSGRVVTSDEAVIRTSSHRARDRIERLIGRRAEDWYYWATKGKRWTVHVQVIPAEFLAEACEIPGVSRAHRYGELHRSW